ncbi:MAG: OsmC family protein [Verrucomicrobia bacterium]|nr:OsmC family protein [Verrucomicrobiota bacterium]
MWEYKTSVKWSGGEAADIRCDGKPTLDITPPPEFGGKKDRWSPEDMLVGAVESCVLLTVLYFVDKMKIGMTSYESEAVGRMERTANGLRFQGIDIVIRTVVQAEEDSEKMAKAVQQAEKFCPVSAAVECPVGVSVESTVASA